MKTPPTIAPVQSSYVFRVSEHIGAGVYYVEAIEVLRDCHDTVAAATVKVPRARVSYQPAHALALGLARMETFVAAAQPAMYDPTLVDTLRKRAKVAWGEFLDNLTREIIKDFGGVRVLPWRVKTPFAEIDFPTWLDASTSDFRFDALAQVNWKPGEGAYAGRIVDTVDELWAALEDVAYSCTEAS